VKFSLEFGIIRVSRTEDGSFALIFDDSQQVCRIKADVLVLTLPCSVYDDITFEDNVIPLDKLKEMKNIKYGTNSKILIPFLKYPSNTTGLINDQIFSNFDIARNILTMHFTDDMNSCFNKTLLNTYAQARPMIEMGFGDACPSFITPRWAEDKSFMAYNTPIGYSWLRDPYAKGSYSYISPGQETLLTTMTEEEGEKFKMLFAPIEKSLYFAGEHASISLEVPGTMEAACESGERVARMILKMR
jgi:monoamine oxidase